MSTLNPKGDPGFVEPHIRYFWDFDEEKWYYFKNGHWRLYENDYPVD